MKSNTIRFSAIAVVIVIAVLLIGYILGVINVDQLQDVTVKTVLVVGVSALAVIGVSALSRKN